MSIEWNVDDVFVFTELITIVMHSVIDVIILAMSTGEVKESSRCLIDVLDGNDNVWFVTSLTCTCN